MSIVTKLTINGQTLWQKRSLENIVIKRFLTKRVYTQNENIDIYGLIVEAHYDDGSVSELPTGSYVYEPLTATSTSGEYLTITYSENGIEKTVTSSEKIIVKALNSINVRGSLAKNIYDYGETISVDGLSVVLNYNDGTTETRTSGFTWSPVVASIIGNNALTVEFGNCSAVIADAFTVNRVLDSIKVLNSPKAVYLPNETCDKTGLRLSANFTEGDPVTIDADSSDWSSVTMGNNALTTEDTSATISYTYNGVTKNVNIAIAVMTGLTVSSMPTKTRYRSGQQFSSEGIEVIGTYNDNEDRIVSDSDYTLSIADGEILYETIHTNGENYADHLTCTVTYKHYDYSESFNIIIDAIKNIAITTDPKKTEYLVGEFFDATGMVVTATWTDESTSKLYNYNLSINKALNILNDYVQISCISQGVTISGGIRIDVYYETTFSIFIPASHAVKLFIMDPRDPDGHVLSNVNYTAMTSNYTWHHKYKYKDSAFIIRIEMTKVNYQHEYYRCSFDGGEFIYNGDGIFCSDRIDTHPTIMSIKTNYYTYDHLGFVSDGIAGSEYCILIENPNYIDVKLEYNQTMCFEGDAKNWKGLNPKSKTLQARSSTRVRFAQNMFATHITSSFVTASGKRFITYANELSAHSLTQYTNTI